MTTLSHRRSSSGVTQLEFRQAMSDFKTMFPEVDEDVIEAILRANNGAVDATIDQLLAMNLDCENERLRTEIDASDSEIPPRYSPATPPPSYQQAVPAAMSSSPLQTSSMAHPFNRIAKKSTKSESNQEQDQRNNHACSLQATSFTPFNNISKPITKNPSKDSKRVIMRWNPPLVGKLPLSFLRIEPDENQIKIANSMITRQHQQPKPKLTRLNSAILQQKMQENERQRQMSVSHDDPELARFLEDERMAIFMQNEEFVRELRRNKDFMSTLELDTAGMRNDNSNHADGAPTASSTHTDSDAAFKETLKHMGKVSRRKFAQLARLFSGRKRKSFQQLLGEPSGANNQTSKDNLLARDREDEYTQLHNENSDTEELKEEEDFGWESNVREHDGHSSGHASANHSLSNTTSRSPHKF